MHWLPYVRGRVSHRAQQLLQDSGCYYQFRRSFAVASPLLQLPANGAGPIELLNNGGVDLDASGVPTWAVIGPSRRGKSVLACLLAGGDPELFPQSHSSFQALTSGTNMVEVSAENTSASCNGRLRIIDTEGLSHVGRSRSQKEALVRQFLISTYLTSSWLIWLDTEVLSTGFFTMMWLVHDYVVDVLRVKEAAALRLPRLMYIRTQETDVQRREYASDFADFRCFFGHVVAEHEDANILTQMFAPGGIHGHSLPLWTVEDLEAYERKLFWLPTHTSPFKAQVASLRNLLMLQPQAAATEGALKDDVREKPDGPPLLALSSLEQLLPKISRLEAFDPRDHENTKVARLRAHLRASYGRLGDAGSASIVHLLNIFDPEDREMRKVGNRIDLCAEAKLEEQCRVMRLELEVAKADREVAAVLERFKEAAPIYSAALVAFGEVADDTDKDKLTAEEPILKAAICRWGLDPEAAQAGLGQFLASREEQFLANVPQLTRGEMKKLNLHERLRWRMDDCIMRLRGKVATDFVVEELGTKGGRSAARVWRLGRWRGRAPSDGKSRRPKETEFALQANGAKWVLYEERFDKNMQGGQWIGIPCDSGHLSFTSGALPLPSPAPPPA